MKAFTLHLFIFMLFGFGCNKLTTENEVAPIVFKGIREIETSSKGTAILLWDRPRGGEVGGFQVFVHDLSAVPEAALRLQDVSDSSSPVILTDAGDETAPVKLGKLIQIVASDKTSFEIPYLLPGRYALQIKAVAIDGTLDRNTKIAILRVESTLGYQGIESADVEGTDVLLKWPALQTSLTSRNVIYTVFEGSTFEVAKSITDQTSIRLSLLGYREGTILYFGVRSTDAKGRTDRNIKTLSVTVPSAALTYEGCVSAEAQGADRILVKFVWPSEDVQNMKIYRDGNLAYSTRDKGVNEFSDLGLSEGEQYTYSCVASRDDRTIVGKKILKLTTLSSNPPTFNGVTGVEIKSPHAALVKWGVSSGVPTDSFWIYASVGPAVDWSADPLAKVSADKLEYLVESLGDDLTYSFGVRACSVKGVCDFNVINLTGSTGDDGAPRTTGATTLVIADGKLNITAPWTHSNCGILKRLVYIKVNGAAPTDTTGMSLASTVPVPDRANPPTLLLFSPIQDNTTYHVLVIDQDPANQKNLGGTVRSLFSGDTTKPIFNGQTSILNGTSGLEETTLQAKFIPIEAEPASTIGATHYLAFVGVGNVNACALTTPHQSFAAINYTANVEATVVITGLLPLTQYSVCIKAQDAAGNQSVNTLSTVRSTLDKTAPAFDGLQSLTYDKLTGELVLGWNPSAASDLYEYTIKLWKNSANPSGVSVLTLKRRSTDAVSSTRVNGATFSVGSLDDVYAIVSACDNAGSVPGGVQNCSVHTDASALKLTLADIQPPLGFLGVEAEPNLGATVEGQILVRWIAPTSWNDYKGFTVYYVNPDTLDLTEAKVCACSGDNCPNQITSCTVSPLEPYKTYRFHVRAYDAVGNMTILDPATYSTSKRVLDSTPPSFSSALQLVFAEAKIKLSWAAATDNQSTTEPGSDIFFEIYRKKGSSFTNLLDPTTDSQAAMMSRVAQSTARTWTDLGADFISGQPYYYTVCAVDATGNRKCDGNVKDYVIPDLLPPTITSFTTNKGEDDYEWTLNWVAADLVTTAPNLLYKIYAKQSLVESDVATIGDTVVYIQSGTPTFSGVRGPINRDVYIHYLLVVEDADGNKASRTLTVFSQNKVTLATVRSTEGLATGNKKIVIVGDGFKPDLQVKIGESDCQSIVRYSKKHIICRTPAGNAGAVNVRVVNADGSSATLANAYTYCSGSGCLKTCNKPSSWGAQFAAGDGSDATPYLICDVSHLNAIRAIGYGKSFVMGENIDLQGVTLAPLHNSTGSSKEFQGKFDGDNFVISNWTYNNISADGIGLFGNINLSSFKNLGLINFDVTGHDYIGTLAGGASVTNSNFANGYYSWNNTIDGIFVTGTVNGNYRVGGVIGHAGAIINNIMAFTNVYGKTQVGGIFGRKYDGGGTMEHHGVVSASGSSGECRVGGIAGEWGAYTFSVINLKNYGSVTCTDAANVNSIRTGGLIGDLYDGDLTNGINYSTVVGKQWTGGLLGVSSRGTMSTLANYGTVSGTEQTGGIIGSVYGRLSLIGAKNTNKITSTSYDVGGLAGRMICYSTARCSIEDSTNSGEVVTTSSTVGGVLGYGEYTDVKNVSNTANVTSAGATGGVVGYMTGSTISDSSSSGNIKSTTNLGTGGILGGSNYNLGASSIIRVTASGRIDGRDDTGGIFGLMYGTVSRASYEGDVTGLGRVGGIGGRIEPGNTTVPFLIELSKAKGTVTGENKCGGLLGEIKDYTTFKKNSNTSDVNCVGIAGGSIGYVNGNNILMEQSSARGAVYGNTPVGGFIGGLYRDTTQNVIVRDSYSRASAKGNDSVGGFAGTTGAVLTRVYSSGKVSPDSTNSRLGGLVGQIHSTGTLTDAFWDKTSSTLSTSALGEGKTTSQMLGSSIYGNFDQAVWSFSATDYPKLLWEVTP